MRSLETIKADEYTSISQEVYRDGVMTIGKSWLYKKQETRLSISNNVAHIWTNQGEHSVLVVIRYNPENSKITMSFLPIGKGKKVISKTFKLNEGSNLKAIFERDSSPTE